MALVSYIIGDCPGCGQKDSYGNVNVTRNFLNRGCLSCRHWDSLPLPELNKRVIYLDQFFFSHAFRGSKEGERFVAARERIRSLAVSQLLVAPFSTIHEDESKLWTPEHRDELFKFIKQTSGGHKFRTAYEVQHRQICKAFDAFIARGDSLQEIDRCDALPSDINDWDDYVWIDVNSYRPDPDALRVSKEQSVDALLALFPTWAQRTSSFDEDVAEEMKSGANSYIRLYIEYVERMVKGDFRALLDSPLATRIVENLMSQGRDSYTPQSRMQRVQAFFDSPYFANVPVERIGAELFALLRQQIRAGAHLNPQKAKRRFKGVLYDVKFIATFAPYCDAMVLDSLMHAWVTDPRIDLTGRFRTRFFSRTNWDAFRACLDEINRTRKPELDAALRIMRPPNAKRPDWSLIGKSRTP